ncbi:MAG TPA: hypothetical protein VIQ30_07165, partial [Pseudonocardia sp.]
TDAANGSAPRSSKPGRSRKSGAHRATPQRPASAKKAAASSDSSARAAAPRSGLGGVVSGLSGGLL